MVINKDYLKLLALFLFVFFIYFGVGTKWTWHVPLDLDHFNPLAQSFLHGRLDIPQPTTTYDLSYYQGHWYPYWGPLPALLLIPFQIILGRFLPLFYLNVFLGSLSVVVIYLLLKRLQKDFLPAFSNLGVLLVTFLFAFGTTHFYLSVNCGVWHTAQIVSFLPTTLGIYLIFKKKRSYLDYFLSSFLISLALLARFNMVFLLFIPFFLGLKDKKTPSKLFLAIALPLFFSSFLFGLYNFLRFSHPFESGYRYVLYHPHFAPLIEEHGLYSLAYIPRNLHYLLFEIPKIVFHQGIKLRFDLEGSSIFFLTPPFLTIFLAPPIFKKQKKWFLDSYLLSLWVSLFLVLLPILLLYTTGWMQFGYRYSLDFMVPLILLSVFGIKGKISYFYFLGTLFAIAMQFLGITALQ